MFLCGGRNVGREGGVLRGTFLVTADAGVLVRIKQIPAFSGSVS